MITIKRRDHLTTVQRLLRQTPVVALLGARQVGKTTLARELARHSAKPVTFLDLEDPRDLALLDDPMLTLGALRGLVVLDEIQQRPELFPVLRVLADRRPLPARFLVLGSAAPTLLQQGSESLAGRIAFHELPALSLDEVGRQHLDRRWRRGGFPRAFLAKTEQASVDWRRDFVRTYLERDLSALGVRLPGATMQRFWSMLAHLHGQTLNSSELARAFGIADSTVRHYVDLLSGTFVVRLLRPFHANIAKRQVRSPKVYISDTGLLHQLLEIDSQRALERHPKVGASWEGFLLETVLAGGGFRPEQCYFWATHAGAELDLVVIDGARRRGFEFKRASAPVLTPSMRHAMVDLELDRLDVVHAGSRSYSLATDIRAVAIDDLWDAL